MANQQRGELGVTVDVAGDGSDSKRYTLRPSFNAICELEDLTGKSWDQVGDDARGGRFNAGLRAVVWCLLNDQHGAEIRTLKDAAEWIERAGGPVVVQGLVGRVFELNDTPGEAKPANPPQAPAVGTGADSLSVPVVSA